MSVDELIVYVDGKYVKKDDAKVSVFDRGILYGDGFFEGIRIYNGKVFKGSEHIDRFFDAAKYIMMPMKYTKQEILDIISHLINVNNIKDGYIRLVMTRGSHNLGILPPSEDVAKPTLICIASSITMYKAEFYSKGIDVIVSSFSRVSPSMLDPQCKSVDYLLNVLAKIEAGQRNAQEAIFLNNMGIVTECTGDNIFIVRDKKVYTPPAHVGILNGITRLIVIEILKKLGYEIYEQEFTRLNIYTADECFLTGTAAEVIGVRAVDGRLIGNGEVGELTKILMKEFKNYINENC